MKNPLGCVRVFTAPQSLIACWRHRRRKKSKYSMDEYAPHQAPGIIHPTPDPDSGVIHLWTDSSAEDNGLESCTAGSAWMRSDDDFGHASLTGLPLSNNVAEVAAVCLALMRWPSHHLHIHSDSGYVLRLIRGGLLSLERDGWPNFPWLSCTGRPAPTQMTGLFKYLLFLLRSHNGTLEFSWVQGHSGDRMNDLVDKQAKFARLTVTQKTDS